METPKPILSTPKPLCFVLSHEQILSVAEKDSIAKEWQDVKERLNGLPLIIIDGGAKLDLISEPPLLPREAIQIARAKCGENASPGDILAYLEKWSY